HDYEMLTMHENVDIKTMFSRFTNITNALQALDKVYTNSEMVRKILRCLPRIWMPKVTGKPYKKGNVQKGETSKLEDIICYECNKPGHFKSDCPRLKKNFKNSKNKDLWSDNDTSSFDEESDNEVVNLCLMESEEIESEVQFFYSFDELQNAYDELVYELENIGLKNIALKKNTLALSKENESLKN
ncbi:zf-CCHC domain-containing protein/UBN2 domain-containing protein, partial [Cephalotus follicularis]